jgi:putative ABC transport system permease protein
VQDIHFALRVARSAPVVTAIIVLTIALGIGANTAIFSIVDAVLIRPLPFPDDQELVSLWATNPDKSIPRFGASYADFLDWQARTRSYRGMAVYATSLSSLNGPDGPESVSLLSVSPGFLSVLGLSPAIGRFFDSGERGEASNAVVLSYGYWHRRFGARATVLGEQYSINGRLRTVIGVLPREAELLGPALAGAPLDVMTVVEPSTYPHIERHAQHLFGAIARLAPNATVEQANAELVATERALANENPEIAGWTASVFRLRDDLALSSRQPLLLLLAAAGVLLLIACINVANLLVVRGVTRSQEIAVRQALGATRARLVRQLVIEGVVLGMAGGILGIAAAAASLGAIRRLVPSAAVPRADDITMQPGVLAFGLIATLVTVLVFGLWPALRLSGGQLGATLRERGRGHTASSNRSRRALVVVELSLALVLAVCAALVVKSMRHMLATNPGFDPANTVTAQVTLGKSYPDSTVLVFYRSLLESLESSPTIEAAGVTDTPPLVGGGIFSSIRLMGEPPRPANDPLMTTIRLVTPGFFKAMGMHLLEGGDIAWNEPAPTIVVSQSAAKEFWHGVRAVDRQIAFNTEPASFRVVGVVSDTRQASLATPAGPIVFVSLRRNVRLFRTMTLVVRSRADVASTVSIMRKAVRELDPTLPLFNVQSLQQIVDRSVAQPRLESILLTVFALSALLLASLGIYGVISYSVTQRQQEIGVRLALGARAGDVIRMVLAEGSLLALVGIAIGSALAISAARIVRSSLQGILPLDVMSLALVALVLLLVALGASALPAWRASDIDPLIAIRRE